MQIARPGDADPDPQILNRRFTTAGQSALNAPPGFREEQARRMSISTQSRLIVILGAGFGGLTASTALGRRLGRTHKITLVDRNSSFFMGLSKLWVLAGKRNPKDGAKKLKLVESHGVKFLQAEVNMVDTKNKKVLTNAGELTYDYLLISLGAQLAPELVPGFIEGAHNLYEMNGIVRLRKELQEFKGGKIAILISSLPFKCPPAPYEATFLVKEILEKMKIADKTDLQVYTPEALPLPVAGPVVGEKVRDLLAQSKIGFNPKRKVKKIDHTGKRIEFEDGSGAEYDLLIGVPPHTVPKVVRDSGLAGPSGWIPVDKKTLKTSFQDIYALGDVASIMTANSLLMPRAGILAEEEGKVVSSNLISEITGQKPTAEFEGKGHCFFEVGHGQAMLAQGEFLAEPAPKFQLGEPSVESLRMKEEFESTRLKDWLPEAG